jgi:hypothetical protein
MVAPCLTRLDAEISQASNDVSRSRLLAEKACYLVRIGEVDRAERIRQQLRERYGDGRDLKTSVHIMVLEGLMSYFQSLGGNASDRLVRAQLLSVAANDKELISLTSAWLGHVQFNAGRVELSIDSARRAVDSIQIGQWGVLARIGLLLGDLFMTVGDHSVARSWYELGRNAAVTYGDQAAIGALTYNQAALRAFDLRIRSALGLEVSPEILDLADAESRSASNYQTASGTLALEHLLVASRVAIKMLKEDYEQAAELIFPLLDGSELPKAYSYRLVLQSDAIYCSIRLSRVDVARDLLSLLSWDEIYSLPCDDQILVFNNLNLAFDLNPEPFGGIYEKRSLEDLEAQYDALRHILKKDLEPLLNIPSTLRW